MNTGNLKSYAPQARKNFIAAVTARANLLGLSETKGALQVAEAEVKNDIVMIAGRAWPVKVNEQRNKLIARMKLQGFGHTVEVVAYAWFNRLAALRYMEVHDYLGHGRRVLSNPQGGLPEVLAHALDLAESNALPGLSADTVRELKLANQDPELYRLILIAQCNGLHRAMPFLFEQLGDETELLLPENLLLTDSVVAKLVQSIPEEDWQQIEIIGWLYQFYISEKKDQVIGKVVNSADIPAATQLFTPNWIVKYMVQNSLGAQWLATYPTSPLGAQMAYYIEPAEQSDEVKAKLAAITPHTLNPENLTLIDPACGSGHILVEAYDLFKAIYMERGYRQRDVAQLILQQNLFGLDIDERAAQLTGFALMMKGRADDRQLFERRVKLNVMALVDSAALDIEELARGVSLVDYGLSPSDLSSLKELFKYATTLGSLIQVPEQVAAKLPMLRQLSEAGSEDLFVAEQLAHLSPLIKQSELLTKHYDEVVANPPYMGSKYQPRILKEFVGFTYPAGKADLYAAFILRNKEFAKEGGYVGMITIPNWLSLSSFEALRDDIYSSTPIITLVHNGRGVWGSDFGSCSFVTRRYDIRGACATFLRLFDAHGSVASNEELQRRFVSFPRYFVSNEAFLVIPGHPVAYWVSESTRNAYAAHLRLGNISSVRQGLATADDGRFLRLWFEVDYEAFSPSGTTDPKWFPFTKGGDFRRWFGNDLHVVNWRHDGQELRNFDRAVIRNPNLYFREAISWTLISISQPSFRYVPVGSIFGHKGPVVVTDDESRLLGILSFLNSNVCTHFLRVSSQTMGFEVGHVSDLPITEVPSGSGSVNQLIQIFRDDWEAQELSHAFERPCLLNNQGSSDELKGLEEIYESYRRNCQEIIDSAVMMETANNKFWMNSFGLDDFIETSVNVEDVTLTVNPAYRYGGKVVEEQQWSRFREDTMAELVSYAIGCMMGRYSLDAPGLIYAHSNNVGFDASHYTKFPADADGIVPITDDLWFEDDAALRIREFLLAVWGADSLEKNLAWLAEILGRKTSESPDEAIRRYLAEKFFKEHLQTYKKRPIYWLFSSGKQGAFQALVYVHRYNSSTLSRLRAQYVVPLIGKILGRIDQFERDVAASNSASQRNKLSKQLEKLRKQHLELHTYDEQLRHHADQRITLNLDDGVKVNYGKFGDLLAEVRTVTGGMSDDQ